MKTRKALLVLSLAVLGPLSCANIAVGQPSSAPPPGMASTPKVVQANKHDVSPALRDIRVIPPSGPPVFREIPRQPLPKRGPKPPTILDPVTQASPGPGSMPATVQNFEGLSNADQSTVSGFEVLPPDTNGDVGPDHIGPDDMVQPGWYVQWVNLAFAIYEKNGTKVYGPAAGNTLWTGFGEPCETSNDGDPIVLHDDLADRWVLSQFALPGPFYQCIAVSQTADPTGAYYRYQFPISDTKLNDYPKLGVWPDGYYMAVNQFELVCDFFCFFAWAGQGVVAFEREKMLAGLPAQMVYFDLFSVDPNLGGMLPSHMDGPAPPLGSPNTFVQFDDDAWGYAPQDQLQLWGFHVDWTTPSNSTFTNSSVLATAPFDSNMCGYSRNCIPQPGTNSKLDAISDRLMYRLQYRNFGTHESLVVNHTVDVGADHAGIRWYEIRDPRGTPVIHQQGTYAPDVNHRWMGSLAMDRDGNLALGFSVASDNTTYPSIRYTGRLAGDPLGSMTQGEATLIAGAGSQTDDSGRWGDYSAMSIDPTDDCTFWYTQEYYATTSIAGWQTRIGSFKLCGVVASGADLSISKADTPDPVNAGATLTYTLNVSNAGPETATDVSVTDTLPVGVTDVSASGVGWTCSGTGPVTCTIGSLPVGAALPITITVTAPAAGGTISNTATVSSATADPNPNNNTATVTTSVQVAPSGSVTVLSPNGGESWQSPSNKAIQWTSSGVSGNVEIALSRDGGGTWEILFANTPNDGSERWRVTRPATTGARIRVRSVNDPRIEDSSDGNFTIR